MISARFLSFLLLGIVAIACISASPIQQRQQLRRGRTSARQVAAAPYPAAGFRPKIPFELPNERQPKRIPIATPAPAAPATPTEGDQSNEESEKPEVLPEGPDGQPEVPQEQPEDVSQPESPIDIQPEGPNAEPENPSAQPEGPNGEPEAPSNGEAPEQGFGITGDSPINPIDGEQPGQPGVEVGISSEVPVDGEDTEQKKPEDDVEVSVSDDVPTVSGDEEEPAKPEDVPADDTSAVTPATADDVNRGAEPAPTPAGDIPTTTSSDADDFEIHTPADSYGAPDAPEQDASAEPDQSDEIGKFVRAPSAKFELPQLARAQQFAVVDVPEGVSSAEEEGGILVLEPVPTYGPPTVGDHTPALAYGIPNAVVPSAAADSEFDVQEVDNEVEDLIAADIAAKQQQLQLLRNFNDLRSGRLVYIPMSAGRNSLQQVYLTPQVRAGKAQRLTRRF